MAANGTCRETRAAPSRSNARRLGGTLRHGLDFVDRRFVLQRYCAKTPRASACQSPRHSRQIWHAWQRVSRIFLYLKGPCGFESHPLRQTSILCFQSLSMAQWVLACVGVQPSRSSPVSSPSRSPRNGLFAPRGFSIRPRGCMMAPPRHAPLRDGSVPREQGW